MRPEKSGWVFFLHLWGIFTRAKQRRRAAAFVAPKKMIRPVAAAACVVLSLSAPPEQIRLALGNHWDEMVVSWATSNTTTPAGYAPTVQWGVASLSSSAAGQSTNYTAFNIRSPFIHRATMTRLQPLTRYTYRVGSDAGGWSVAASFTSGPGAKDKAYPFTFLAYGDMGISNSEATAALTAAKVGSGEAAFIIHSGDIAYAGTLR